jgi:3-oxoacyl-[acyl-carrier-protein] synthase II
VFLMGRDVLITSLGAVTGAGTGIDALHQALAAPDWRPEVGLSRPDAGPLAVVTCRDFSPKGVLPPMVARRLDRPARMLAVAARETLAPLGETLPWDRDRIGITAGTWTAGTTSLVEVLRAVFMTNPDEAPPAEFPSTVANAAASQLGILERLGGPNLTFAEKQVGGLRAILEAARMLGHDRADAVLAAGVDEANWLNSEGYERIGSLRRDNGPGMLLGEGAAVALLTNQAHSPALARLAGAASAGVPTAPYRYPDDPEALVTACRQALDHAGLEGPSVDLVIGLGNGIPALDRLEVLALDRALGSHRPAALTVTDRLGEGAFASAVRVLVAVLTVAGRIEPAWGPGSSLAAAGFPALSRRPDVALVTGQACGGSAIAVVITAP